MKSKLTEESIIKAALEIHAFNKPCTKMNCELCLKEKELEIARKDFEFIEEMVMNNGVDYVLTLLSNILQQYVEELDTPADQNIYTKEELAETQQAWIRAKTGLEVIADYCRRLGL